MNIYEQLQAVREDLVARDASFKTLRVVDKMITMASPQRDSTLSMSRLQVLRHAMRTPDVLNDEDIRLDFLALEGDLEEQAEQRSVERPAYEEERKPKSHKFYKDKNKK